MPKCQCGYTCESMHQFHDHLADSHDAYSKITEMFEA